MPETEAYYDKQIRELKLQQEILQREIDAYTEEKQFFLMLAEAVLHLDEGDAKP
jgi:hypothetical protein